jgi:hypothetical protein
VKIYSQLKLNKMKKQILQIVTAVTLLSIPNTNYAQAPTLGTTAGFVIFTTSGAVGNNAISQITGNVGTNDQPTFTGFGNVNGVMHNQDGATGQAATDLLSAYNQLNATVPTFSISTLLGNSDTLIAGVYHVPAAAVLNDTLILNAQSISSAVFIFKIHGTFSTNTNSKIKLIKGALACNVYWQVEGVVSMAPGTGMKGTVIANNAAINMNTGDTLEGRIFSTAGAINVDGVHAYIPVGCGSPVLNGPAAPNLLSTECFALFSTNGPVTNTDTTYVTGDVGDNVGLTTGYNPGNITGTLHPIPDGTTNACAADLLTVYNYLNLQTVDIELLYPVQFGRNLVLTPHVYLLNAAVTFTDTLYLNALGNSNAVFLIRIQGALSTSVYSKVRLINGALSKNVFWQVEGATSINNFSEFVGTLICNNGAISLNKGMTLDGRALTTNGAVNTDSIMAVISTPCPTSGIQSHETTKTAEIVFYPNPITTSTIVKVSDASEINSSELRIYDVLGMLVLNTTLTKNTTVIETNFSSGVYFYKVIGKNGVAQSGKLISQ